MDDNLEVFFCDLCGTSVPEKDLENGEAQRLHGKLIGACCVAEMRGAVAPARSDASRVADSGGGGGRGLVTVGVIFLVALAAATIWIEYRMSEVTGSLGDRVDALDRDVKHQNNLWGTMDRRLGATLDDKSLQPVRDDLATVQVDTRAIAKDIDQVITKLDTQKAQISGFADRLSRLASAQEGHGKALEDLIRIKAALQRLNQNVQDLAAAPRATGGGEAGEPVPTVVESGAPKGADGLPKALQHHVSRLTDEDPSTRFEAVDQLIQSKDRRVLEHLLPMMKDPDLFVRRLCAEGLAGFRDKDCVEALLVALADPESLVRHSAYSSIKKLTGQKIVFDPDGKASARSKQQRKWQEWWGKNRDSFK